jgi:hypothetical protein
VIAETWKFICSDTCALLTVHFGTLRVHARVYPNPDWCAQNDSYGWFAYREERPTPSLGYGYAPTMLGAMFAAEDAIHTRAAAEGL